MYCDENERVVNVTQVSRAEKRPSIVIYRLSTLSHQACASDTVALQVGALASYPIIR